MAKTIKVKATDGSDIEFVDEVIGSGAMKDVYFSPDKTYVVGFFKGKLDVAGRSRIEEVTSKYREGIFTQTEGDFWKGLFCWPTKIVEWNGKTGIVCPTYDKQYFFEDGRFKGKEKNGKWFASAKLMNRFIEPQHKGNWFNYIQVCIKIARAVNRLHSAGLSHSDLSYNNILINPSKGNACIIDCDGLVVPGRFPPDVIGTPDFIAPEVMQDKGKSKDDKTRNLPSRKTDLHALAVLIYMFLLRRHPLRGGKVHDLDPAKDEELTMGAKAMFIEHPTDKSNRPKKDQLDASELPQGDVDALPYTICGPYLKPLFERAFIDGLHDASKRPSANDWLNALIKTADLMQPCGNPSCRDKWFVFDNSKKPKCPFCGTTYDKPLPVLNLYYSPRAGSFLPENHRIMVFEGMSLYVWHKNRFKMPNEKLTQDEKRPIGDFFLRGGKWYLANRRMNDLWDCTDSANMKQVPINSPVELSDGRKLLMGKENGDRLIVVQLANV